MSSIANLGQVSDSLDTAAKFFRVMESEGVSLDHLVHPVNDRGARRNLSVFLKAGCPEFVVPEAVEPALPPLLIFDDAHVASVDISGEHDPGAFWRDTDEAPKRRVWGTFQTTVVARARPIASQGIANVPYADTPRKTTVREIMEAPGVGDHDPSKLSRLIATMITKQPNGESLKDGLLNDGRGNFFKCGSVLASVDWRGIRRGWSVLGWSP